MIVHIDVLRCTYDSSYMFHRVDLQLARCDDNQLERLQCWATNNIPLSLTGDSIVGRDKNIQHSVGVKKVIFSAPATIVLWEDGTKTVVKCQEGDTFDEEKGLALCFMKKALGNKSNFNNFFKKWIPEETDEYTTPSNTIAEFILSRWKSKLLGGE